jgi:uncharacterized protein
MLPWPSSKNVVGELHPFREVFLNTVQYVQDILSEAEAGHDWNHVQRVYQSTLSILEAEESAGRHTTGVTVLAIWGALLHDVADEKFHPEDHPNRKSVQRFVEQLPFSDSQKGGIEHLIQWVSFKNSFDGDRSEELSKDPTWTKALHILRDADRLDAIGAVGLARAFHYGGYKNRLFFDEDTQPVVYKDSDAYHKSAAPTINHFYEKLLLLKGSMHTQAGREEAESRHQFLLQYLRQFYAELGYSSPPPGFELASFE